MCFYLGWVRAYLRVFQLAKNKVWTTWVHCIVDGHSLCDLWEMIVLEMSSYQFQSGEVYIFVYVNLGAGYRLHDKMVFLNCTICDKKMFL